MSDAPEIRCDLGGWVLRSYLLRPTGRAGEELNGLVSETAASVREAFSGKELSADPDVAAIRRLFREAGCDPTRYRPSSEALLRRVLKGEAPPSILPVVDLNNLLSLRLRAPACVADFAKIVPPVTFRAGRSGEEMLSMRGPFPLEGKPLLEDSAGPFGTPITDSERVKVRPGSSEIWLLVYLASEEWGRRADGELGALLAQAPVAERIDERGGGR